MSKKRKALSLLKLVVENLELLDGHVDVDRMIGISNAQGPLAKLVRSAVLEGELPGYDFVEEHPGGHSYLRKIPAQIRPPKRRSAKKATEKASASKQSS